MRILITGGAGFIGYHLARHLLATGSHQLLLVDNLQRGKMDADLTALLADRRIEFRQADLTDPAFYPTLPQGFDHVYHLAAVNGTRFFYEIPQEVLRINTLSLVLILDWFRRFNAQGKFCYPSSSEVYAGALEAFGILPIPTPETVPLVIADPYNPRSSYDSSKLIGEPFVIHYAQHYNFRALIVRPHNFYGPRAGYDHVIPDFCRRIAARVDPFPIYGADNTRTFCYIDDVARAMQQLMDSAATDGQPVATVNIGDIEEITMTELAEKMFAVAGWRPQRIEIHPAPEGSVKRRLADISKLQKLIGWAPQISLEDGLRRTYQWYQNHPPR
ncbi:MAG: GDP-mannose 4,6-dehydratase [Candidatus Magasanikbacteria bacterium]|nr:GDP-mannose 4,6-dehydratase [Candidatus Magasanikbacteria bacterium]